MKITVEVADPLLRKAKQKAAREGTTLRNIVESGLREQVAPSSGKQGRQFSFRPLVVHGNGLQPEFEGAGWDKIRDAIYEGRGS